MSRRSSWKDSFASPRLTYVLVAFAVIVVALSLRYVVTAPPHRLVIAADGPDGYFTHVAKMYEAKLAAQGVTLEIVSTNGAMDNVARIDAPGSNIDVAFVHGGLTDAKASPNLESLGSIAYDPLWVVYRTGAGGMGELDDLSKLRGHSIGIGKPGSGTEAIAKKVLAASGVSGANSTFTADGDEPEGPALALTARKIDAAFVMGPPEDPKIRALFSLDGIAIMNMTEAEGVSRNLPFLHALTIPKGTVDLGRDAPDHDLSIVASTITLVARKDVHPALIYVLMSIIDDVHEPPSLLHKENEFPSDKDIDLPLSPQAEAYYKNGKPILQRYLPFALASAVERLLKVLVPVVLVLLPIFRGFPAFNQWRVKRKLARSYRQLLEVERQAQAGGSGATAADYEARLQKIEEQVHAQSVPLIYSNELYILREHVELARRHIADALDKPKSTKAQAKI